VDYPFSAEGLFVRAATFISLFLGVLLLAGSVALGVHARAEKRGSVERALLLKASEEAEQLEEYFARSRSITLITAHNPAFRDFYAAPGRRVDKVRAGGFAIRRAEDGLAYLEQLYPTSIGGASFIDRAGPENALFVRGVRPIFKNLSPDESGSPFFKATFALRAGQVFQTVPYVSPDTHEWVISNSTPVPSTGYPAAAIVSFEITLASFQRTVAAIAKQDEVAIVDAATGKVIEDSRFEQRLGAAMGKPRDRRFVNLVARGHAEGTMTIGEHRAAFRRLQRTPHNANDWYVVSVERRTPGTLLGDAGWAPAGMAAAALALLVLGGITFRNSRSAAQESERSHAAEAARTAAERDYHETQREFTEIMQITRDEDEAYRLLKRHLQRSLPSSDVLVLNRNNSHDRLEPMTEIADDSALAAALRSAEPDSCLAVRLGKPHERSDDQEPLLTCELCGAANGYSTCVPSLVGGEVIGSVLVQHPLPFDAADRRRIEESMTQASPVLANLRNLALSQTRALTDGLTGLPNRRSIDDTLKRMAAHAERTSTSLGTVLVDLDRFKQINDLCGHEKGDEVLAAVGAVITDTLRASDFAGRFGGEEFILLLPDTDRAGAVAVAEKLRLAIAAIEVAGVSGPITVSLGVAAVPEDAAEPTLLIRAADRALYLAKAHGRNRVETIASEESEPLDLSRA
jgi:diguanylate cyclase (GGDEF)-like protein